MYSPKPTAFAVSLTICILGATCPTQTHAQCEVAKLTASGAERFRSFGQSVSIDGDLAVIGASRRRTAGQSAVYIFRREGTGWVEEAELAPSDAGSIPNQFGHAVAISGEYVAVGDFSRSRTYIFRREGNDWVEEAKLYPIDGTPVHFGVSVSISGDSVLVGAQLDDHAGERSGSAFIFTRVGSEWIESAMLTASDATEKQNFGFSGAIDGDYALIGAPAHSGSGPGAAYVFRREGEEWVEEAKLTASDAGEERDLLGWSVAISGDVAVVGANLAGTEVLGAAYVYRRDGTTWTEEAILSASDAFHGQRFGADVATDGNLVLVGAYGGGSDMGAVYIFGRNDNAWVEEGQLTGNDPGFIETDEFGSCVAISGGVALVGAKYSGFEDVGATYVFNVLGGTDCNANTVSDSCEPDCNSSGIPDDCDIADGTSEDCNDNGMPDECERDEDCNVNGNQDICDIADGTSTDCEGNGTPDECELFEDCNGNGNQDSCDLADQSSEDCNENLIPDECDVGQGTASDCNGNAIPDVCDIADATSGNCNGNDVPDECDIASGLSQDCNTNGVPDSCELAARTSPDCNFNAVPDECDLASGTSADCNENGVPDFCDVIYETSEDRNGDFLPDECEVHGDVNDDGKVDLADILCVLDGFQGVFDDCRLEQVDIAPCDPDGKMDLNDILAVLDAFQGIDVCPIGQ